MSLKIKYTNQFKKDYKKVKSFEDNYLLFEIITKLKEQQKLVDKYKDHKLLGEYEGRRECHIKPDWLLIYKVDEKYLILERIGSHSELFK